MIVREFRVILIEEPSKSMIKTKKKVEIFGWFEILGIEYEKITENISVILGGEF